MRLLIFIFLFISTSATTFAQGDTATIYLKSRQIITAQITGIDQKSIRFQMRGTTTPAQILNDQIENIIWPEPAQWKQGVTALEEKKYKEAAAIFEKFLLSSGSFTKYPAPGNFVTRARLKLLQIHRAQMNGAGVARELDRLQPELALLPPGERNITPAYDAWSAFSKSDPTAVLGHFASHPENAEIAYLAGLAYQQKGRPVEAESAFTKAYALEAGGNFQIAKLALRQSILIEPTVTKVHIWATVYGNGKLWENAPQQTISLLQKPVRPGNSSLGERESTDGAEDFDRPGEKVKRVK